MTSEQLSVPSCNVRFAAALCLFLSAAQPIGQGPERVLVLVVAAGTHFISTKVHFFRVGKVANFFGCVKSITFAQRCLSQKLL